MIRSAPRFLFFAIFCVICSSNAFGVLGNAWHIPFNKEIGGGTVTMRNPAVEIGSTTQVFVYSGNYAPDGDQNGGYLIYRKQGDASWQSHLLTFDSQVGNNKYFKASLDMSAFPANAVIEYYLKITYTGGSPQDTYLYGGDTDGTNLKTGTESVAQASPYSFRNRPAWIFHADNRVLLPASDNNANHSDVQFWAKIGYIGDVNNLATRWVTNGAVYYTTDGSAPVPGSTVGTAGNAATQVVAFSYDHPESNNQSTPSIAGTAMWWAATVPNLPLATTIKYKVGFWNSANADQKFGDYNAGDGSVAAGHQFSFTIGNTADPILTIKDTTAGTTLNGNYTTSKLFVDEVAGTSAPLQIQFTPTLNAGETISAVQIVTNLNQRDVVTADKNSNGIEDSMENNETEGIIGSDASFYYRAYDILGSGLGGTYTANLSASKTGAYRLTARWQVAGDASWRWFTNIPAGRRDHAITVSPVDARNVNLYEVNVLNVEADAADFSHRSTFEDLWNDPNGAPHSGSNRWDLNYVKNLGCNWLWFQPIHPIGQEGQTLTPGSPYAVKNFFEINPLMTKNFSGSDTNASDLASATNRAAAMTAFQNFVAAADTAGVSVMLDAPFNHTSPDAELSAKGVQYLGTAGNPSTNWQSTDLIRDREARFYSRDVNYSMRASGTGNIAIAPDRGDFGKWSDVRDVFFGRYAALVDVNPDGNGNYNNEQDWFDYSIGDENSSGTSNGHFDSITQGVWKYFADYPLFWLTQTGVPPGSSVATQTAHGIHGLRADFGQGLPPQLWEYIINKTRARKWNFVFMAESLDGGAVTYRSNRHFDLLNENIVFPLKSASSTTDFRNIFEGRRSAYGQGLVLLNDTSHDEENYDDPWQALVRYAVCNIVDGAPLIFPGQELGISRTFGYDQYEINFGKQIANFKRYNSMMPAWNDTNYGNDQLYPVYAGIGLARQFSPALRSSNRYFLDQTGGGGTHPKIFAAAKFQAKNASPALSDVVFAFANIDRDNNQTGNFDVNQDTDNNGVNDYGIKPSRVYNVKNIAAYIALNANRRNAWQWGSGRTGTDVLTNGVFVSMNKVPTMDSSANANDPAWNQRPYEAQYLKMYDVTPAGAPVNVSGPRVYDYALGGSATFTWAPATADNGNVAPNYTLNISINGTNTQTSTNGTSYTVNGLQAGQTVSLTINAKNPDDPTQTASSGAASHSIQVLDPNGDQDGDGIKNADEDTAGTNPLDNADLFHVTSVVNVSANGVQVTWASVPGKKYQVESTSDLGTSFSALSGTIIAGAGETTKSYTDSSATGGKKFYRVKIVP